MRSVRYRWFIADRSILRLLLAGVFGRLAMSVVPLGMVLTISGATRSFALAGLAAGAQSVTIAATGPLRGRLVDRYGEEMILGSHVAVYTISLLALVGVAVTKGPAAAYVIAGAAAGASTPPVSAAIRGLWSEAVDATWLQAIHTFDSIIEEAIFVLGPLIAGLCAFLATPSTALIVAAFSMAIGVGFVIWQTHRIATVSSDASPSRLLGLGPIRVRGLQLVLLPLISLGVVLGLLGVAVPAFSRTHAMAGAAGIVLALLSLGGVVGGLLYGRRPWAGPAFGRYSMLFVGFAVPLVATIWVPGVPLLGVVLFAAGLFMTPIYATAYLLANDVVESGSRTEASAWVGVANNLGVAVGAGVAGALVDALGVGVVWYTATAVGWCGAVIALLWRTSRRPLESSHA